MIRNAWHFYYTLRLVLKVGCVSLERSDIQEFVSRFEERHDPYARYASFDYCYNYFHPSTGNDLLGDMEKSCLALGFYLASWGMFRGSSFMLEKSAKNFENLVGYIASQDSCAWSIDVDSYTSENIEYLLDQYNEIRTILVPQNTSHLTLVTKIMLGVFGSVPANDRFFKQTFGDIFKGECGFSRINTKSLDCLSRFYQSNKLVIDQVSSNRMTVDFNSGVDTTLPYTKAKVVDMYGFTKAITST